MSKLFLEVLDNKRKEVYQKLDSFSEIGILGGGTALALQIGHRVSFDFDIFTHNNLDKDLWAKSKKVFGTESVKLLDDKDQLDIATQRGVNITFFYDDYKQVFRPLSNSPIDLMNIKDIAINKTITLGRRPKWRDYVDLYFLLKEKYIDLNELVEISTKKLKNDFSEKLFLEQLVYYNDVQNYDIEFVKKEIDSVEIKNFLENEVKEFKRKSLGFF